MLWEALDSSWIERCVVKPGIETAVVVAVDSAVVAGGVDGHCDVMLRLLLLSSLLMVVARCRLRPLLLPSPQSCGC